MHKRFQEGNAKITLIRLIDNKKAQYDTLNISTKKIRMRYSETDEVVFSYV